MPVQRQQLMDKTAETVGADSDSPDSPSGPAQGRATVKGCVVMAEGEAVVGEAVGHLVVPVA